MHGVGILGAGPAAWAVHAPTLGNLCDDFRIVHVADASGTRAPELAARHGARCSQGMDELIADPEVDVVVVCLPPEKHAAAVLAAISAGKHVLCEKPLATQPDDARAIVDAARERGVALVVGTNHLHDPVWRRSVHELRAGGQRITGIVLTLSLPPNGRYHALVAVPGDPFPAPQGGPPLGVPQVAADVVRRLITGLVMHDLPLVRDLLPEFEGVDDALALAPLGCAIGFRASGIPVRVTAAMLPSGAEALWRMSVHTDQGRLLLEHPPAFVRGGSAIASILRPDGSVERMPPEDEDGYVREWRALADIIAGRAEAQYDEALADALYAHELAEAAAGAVLAGATSLRAAAPAPAPISAPASSATERVRDGLGRTAIYPAAPGSMAAVAELAATAFAVDGPTGAVAVVPGDGAWPDRVRAVVTAGAVAVVVVDPSFVAAERIRDLAQCARVPVVVVRTMFREMDADAAVRGPRAPEAAAIVVEVAAPGGLRARALRDAIGWARVLAGAPVRPVVAVPAPGSLSARAVASGMPVSVLIAEREGGVRIEAVRLAPRRCEVAMDHGAGVRRLEFSDESGTVSPVLSREGAVREGLRRVLDALGRAVVLDDLALLAADAEAAEVAMSAPAEANLCCFPA